MSALVILASGVATEPVRSQATPPSGSADDLSILKQRYAHSVEQWPAAWIDQDVTFVEFGLPSALSTGPNEQQWVALGEQLFRDPILSAEGDLSCASCHQRAHGWSTASRVATGHQGRPGRRNPPSLHTASRHAHLSWDGRGTSLAQQSLRPLVLGDELGNPDIESVLRRLRSNARYATGFAALKTETAISADDLGKALVAFQRTLDTPSRFDRFMSGDHRAISDLEIQGLHLFRTKARCANCHMGSLLSDGRFHNLKISFFGEKSQDLGRYEITGRPEDVGRFRTPSLRHVSKTAPYMHNGLFETLEGVINLYDRGGGEVWARNSVEVAHPLYPFAARLSPHIRPLDLSTDEKAALLAFLRAL